MADGDEKIDHNDRVLVLNRVTDAPTAIMFDGKTVTWEPGKARSMQRLEAEHYIKKSTIRADPTDSYFPIQRLVVVTETGTPTEPGATAAPLTEAACREIAKFGSIDTTKLPPDRMVGGYMLMDEDGQHPTGIALKINPTGSNLNAPPLTFAPKVADATLDDLTPAA